MVARFSLMSLPKTSGRVSGKSFSLGPDGTFAIHGLMPGVLNFGLNAATVGESPSLRIVRTELNGSNEPVEIKAGDNITGLNVVLVEATGSLRGTAKFVNGNPPANIRGTAGVDSGQIPVGWAAVDGRGYFLIDDLPAGTYRLIVTLEVPGARPASTRSEQTIDISEHQVSEVVVWLDPQPHLP